LSASQTLSSEEVEAMTGALDPLGRFFEKR
jgi:hypothetical protein